jgi:hypothetical protein
MGHSSIVVTERYSHVANDDMTAAVNRLNYFLPNLLPSLRLVSHIQAVGAL